MHDIKIIRKDPDFFSKKLAERNSKINLKDLLDLDKKNRELIQAKEKLEQEKKIISQKKDKNLFEKSKKISEDIDQLDKKRIQIKNKIESVLNYLPNIALEDVPVGKDESKNKEIKKVGEIPKFDFTPLSHDQIGKDIKQMDFDIATKTAGARFVFLRGQLALLERAISNFMLDIKAVRKDPNYFSKKLSDRNVKINFNKIIDLDKKNRELIQKKEKLEQEKKIISKKKDKTQFSRSKEISKIIEDLNDNQLEIKNNIDKILNAVPNIALNDVPIGKDENSNKVINQIGESPKFNKIFKSASIFLDFNFFAKKSGCFLIDLMSCIFFLLFYKLD